MPNWKEELDEIQSEAKKGVPNPPDNIIRKYLLESHKRSGGYVITYYSGWLQLSNSNI